MRLGVRGLTGCVMVLGLLSACTPTGGPNGPAAARNRPPLVDAGDYMPVVEGQTVELDGSSSTDPDGDPLIYYRWRQTAGPQVVLLDAGTPKASFEAPAVQSETTLTFQLVVEDSRGNRGAAMASVVVRTLAANLPAQLDAVAGEDQTVPSGSQVALHGEYRGGTGQVSYQWEQHSFPRVVLSGEAVASPTFTAPEVASDTTLIFELTVTDQTGQTNAEAVQIKVKGILVAEAGDDQTVFKGAEVELAGSASGGFGEQTFHWRQDPNDVEQVALTDANTPWPSFTAPEVGERTTLRFELAVTDEADRSATDTVEIDVVSELTALAGDDQTVAQGLEVTLAGSAVGAVGAITYHWIQIDGQIVELSDANAPSTTFAAPEVDGLLRFRLTATHENGETDTDTVDVVVASRIRFSTTMGDFVILLRPDKAPIGVENFMTYVNEGFYEGLIMHRIEPNFVVQGGGFYPDLSEKSTHEPIPLESNNGLYNARSWVAYARTGDPDSATSQFFVNLVDNTLEGNQQFGYGNLDYVSAEKPGYAVFGRIVEGMDVIDAIAQSEMHSQPVPWHPEGISDVPVEDIIINKVTVE